MIQSINQHTNAAIGEDKEILKDIHMPKKNIAIYQRDIQLLHEDLKQLSKQVVEYRVKGSVEEILSGLRAYFSNHFPDCTTLLEDISDSIAQFKEISQASSFRLLFSTVSTNMCRKFHTDVNDVRMLCTYIGPGTLWVPDEAIDLDATYARGNGKEVVIDLEKVKQAGTGDVIILKGALYPEANAILHRSPTIEENGEKRLLLRIDTYEALGF
ncbi:MAG: DUF1826 domain-containing protein [Bacteroidota bacterium]